MSEFTFEYGIARVRELHARLPEPAVVPAVAVAVEGGGEGEGEGAFPAAADAIPAFVRPVVSARLPRKARAHVQVGGEWLRTTPRFWKSFFHRYGINDSVFRYFEPDEVFARVAERAGDDALRFCVERDEKGAGTLLAVGAPAAPFIRRDEVMALVERYGGADVVYHQGVVTSTHTPRSGEHDVQIGRDAFRNRFVVEVPVDGYGRPQVYLSLLRLLCLNGAVGYSPSFRSEIGVGKDVAHSVARAMEGFDSGEGFAALRQRFASAQTSWASLREVLRVRSTLANLGSLPMDKRDEALRGFDRVAGDVCGLYGLANPEALSARRKSVLPARCRVYDVLNFLTELATHHASPESARALQAAVGDMLADEYDLEGTATSVTEFDDFLLGPPPATPRDN